MSRDLDLERSYDLERDRERDIDLPRCGAVAAADSGMTSLFSNSCKDKVEVEKVDNLVWADSWASCEGNNYFYRVSPLRHLLHRVLVSYPP